MTLSNKHKWIVACLLFATIILLYFFLQKKSPEQLVEIPSKREHTIPARPETFAEGADVLTQTIRKTRIALAEYDYESAKFYINEARILWNDVVDEFASRPSVANDPEQWQDHLNKIHELIDQASASLDDNNIEKAAQGLDQIRSEINYSHQSDDPDEAKLFSLLQEVSLFSSVSSYEKSRELLPALKITFAESKHLSKKENFQEAYSEFESVLASIDSSTKNSFPKHQSQLMPAFMRIYEAY